MTTLYFDRKIDDESRRARILRNGDLFVYSPNRHSEALIALARELLWEAFDDTDPETAQYRYPVETYAQILARVKPQFIHHAECKRILPALLESHGCDPDTTYFDVPRMRSSTAGNYLTTGIAYAFHSHRDTWYSAPLCQINWWLPIFDVDSDNALAFHPAYWNKPIANNSEIFNYQDWHGNNRFDAVRHLKQEDRPHSRPTEPVAWEPSIVAITPPGGALLFAASHLHSSIPNTSDRTRFSIDFRVVNLGDLKSLDGAPNLDCKCTGSAIDDYLRMRDLAHVPAAVQALYRKGHPQPLIA
ncbi:MAG: hypothetical protein AB7G13_07300 [Lautropia sp.]